MQSTGSSHIGRDESYTSKGTVYLPHASQACALQCMMACVYASDLRHCITLSSNAKACCSMIVSAHALELLWQKITDGINTLNSKPLLHRPNQYQHAHPRFANRRYRSRMQYRYNTRKQPGARMQPEWMTDRLRHMFRLLHNIWYFLGKTLQAVMEHIDSLGSTSTTSDSSASSTEEHSTHQGPTPGGGDAKT